MQNNKIKIWEPNKDIAFYDKHITFTSVSYIKSLLECLSDIGINYFTFDRTYIDGSHIRLTTAGDWIKHYYQEKLYNVAIFEHDPKGFTEGFLFWDWLKREPIYSEAALYDIDHGVTITKPNKDYCDFYHFGTSRNNKISQEKLTNYIHYLYKFIALFKEKAHNIILEAEATRFILPIKSQTEICLNQIKEVKKLNISKNIQRLYLGDKFDNTYLTRKEMEVLFYLKNGKRVHEIAKRLYISTRTAQTHINHIKEKLKCKTMFDLGYITKDIGINNIFSHKLDI